MADDTESRCGGCRSGYRFGEDVPGRQVSIQDKALQSVFTNHIRPVQVKRMAVSDDK